MSYTVNQLITNACYLSGLVARGFQQPQANQYQEGLNILNGILGDKVIDSGMIPYFTRYNFTSRAGQEEYFIPNLIQLSTLVFFMEDGRSVRYHMDEASRRNYFGSTRADKIGSLPFNWHLERCFGGSKIFMYFVPNVNYPIQACGLFRLPPVAIGQDLESNVTTVDLGLITITGTGTLGPGQLLINEVDISGSYTTSAGLASAINGLLSPRVTAQVQAGVNHLILSSGEDIVLTTGGGTDLGNTITFSNFSTVNGARDNTFFPAGLDRFYINYLENKTAGRICINNTIKIPEDLDKQIDWYESRISKCSQKIDLRNEKISTLTKSNGLNYAIINFGGWV